MLVLDDQLESIRNRNAALQETLQRICVRSRGMYARPLKVQYYGLDVINPAKEHPLYCITETRWDYTSGIIPRRGRRNLFGIHPGFYNEANGEKEIRCIIFDEALFEIAQEEVRVYADIFQATGVHFARRHAV